MKQDEVISRLVEIDLAQVPSGYGQRQIFFLKKSFFGSLLHDSGISSFNWKGMAVLNDQYRATIHG